MVAVIRIAVLLVVLAAWDLSVRLGWIDPMFLAGPLQTVEALTPVARDAAPDIASTLGAFAVALLTGVLLAAIFGAAISLSGYAYRVLAPLFVVGVTLPKVTLLPVFILWFGIEKTTIIVYGALSGFFPMIVNVMAATREIKPNQILLAKAMGFGQIDICRKVLLPAMLPVLSSGLFYACNASLMGVFIVELALARHGIGAVVHDYAMTFQTAELYAAVALTAAITVAINLALWYSARYFGRWRG